MTDARRWPTRSALVVSVLSLASLACGSPAPPATVSVPAIDIAPVGTVAPETMSSPGIVDGGAPMESGPPSVAESALQEWGAQSQCPGTFDYHPKGGLQSFWCRRPGRLTLAAVRELAGVDVFSSGPHQKDGLNLAAANEFGHYNPAFVAWLVEKGAPSPRNSRAREATQASYDAHLKPLATVFWRTLGKVRRETACVAREKSAYANAGAKKQLPRHYYERWFYFMNPFYCEKAPGKPANELFKSFVDNGFDGGVDGNVTKTVVGFWLRRSIDGTLDSFADGLKKLIASYDPELLERSNRAPDSAAITKALEAGVAQAAACKDPSAAAPTVRANITISADGKVSARAGFPVPRRPPSVPLPPSSPQNGCIEQAFGAQTIPAFDGADMRFARTVPLK